LNLTLDAAANAARATGILSADSAVKILTLPIDEEEMIAIHAAQVLAEQGMRPQRDYLFFLSRFSCFLSLAVFCGGFFLSFFVSCDFDMGWAPHGAYWAGQRERC